MAKKVDRIIVIDVESTCWEDKPPAGQESEIIEIGICTIDVASGKRLEKESILVKPEKSQVSQFCTQLTTLTQAQFDRGISLKEACIILKNKYQTQQRIWAS
jgi:inhibitor of KinA sporulation pathway (predicted exonuclease)